MYFCGLATCLKCPAGKYAGGGEREAYCSLCPAAKYSDVLGATSINYCMNCPVGKFSAGEGAAKCTSCPKLAGQFANIASENYFNSRSTTIGTGTASEDGCICGLDSNGLQLVQVTLQASTLFSVGSNRVCLCNKGFVMSNTQLPTCTKSSANYYHPQVGGFSKPCPANSYSAAGSDSWDDCQCNAGFYPEAIFDVNRVQTGFNCYCKPGYYVKGTECVKCQICDPRTHPGHYKDGCGQASAGECKKCAICDNPSQQRAGCGLFSAGECKDKDELVRTPFCPVQETDKSELAKSVRQASGLGAFSFEHVFGTDATGVDFVCSAPCDGVMYNSIQCDGPFACNIKTCAEKTAAGDLPRACPVVIEEKDQKAVRERKRRETCVQCKECGHVNEYFGTGLDAEAKYAYYEHWGGGCVRECSKLMCADNNVWDWTARGCKRCSELRDVRLCSRSDRVALRLETRSVTGNWPLLYFPECEGESASKKLETLKYGACAVCDSATNKAELCPAASQYPAACHSAKTVACQPCHRAGRAGDTQVVEVFKGSWYNSLSTAFEPLHCQIGACIDRGGAWTGVGDADRLCTQPCSAIACSAHEILVPCRLPHDARCEQLFPAPSPAISSSDKQRYAGDEVNLLNELDDMKHRRFASFENTLIVLGNTDSEYQCVWNADGIFDSKASPAGISNVLWKPGRSDDEQYTKRGTQVCRTWVVERGVHMPLLPLQNTISASETQEMLNVSSRRMLVNTEAYVLSYRFGGSFAVSDAAEVHGGFTDKEHTPDDRMLSGANVGAAGRLFLMLRMHEAQARVAVTMPSDRKLHEAMWVQALLLSFAVVDLTQYAKSPDLSAHVSVSAAVTADEKHISDSDDNFVLESFWVQDVSESVFVKQFTVQGLQCNNLFNGVYTYYETLSNGYPVFVHLDNALSPIPNNPYGQGVIYFNGVYWHMDVKIDMVSAVAYGRDPFTHFAYEVCGGSFTPVSGTIESLSPPLVFFDHDLGNSASLFTVQILNEHLNQWTRCTVQDTLALSVVDMEVAPFAPNHNLSNYSWLEQHHGSSVPFNLSVACFQGGVLQPAEQCTGAKDAAAVYVRRQPYAYEPVAAPAGQCPQCKLTTDRTLLGLRHVQEHLRGLRADEHVSSSSLVQYVLQQHEQPLQLLQAHAWDPFDRCAALLTTHNTTHSALLCLGTEGTQELERADAGDATQYIGVFACVVGGVQEMFLLQKGLTARSSTLRWRDAATQTQRIVLDPDGLSLNWVSVTAEQERIVALGIDTNNRLQVGFYAISKPNGQNMQLSEETSSISLAEISYEIVEEAPSGDPVISIVDPWLPYSRVAACSEEVCAGVFLAASIRLEQVKGLDGKPGGSRLQLSVCSGTHSAAACFRATIPVPADSLPSFISVAFLRASAEAQHWVVGVHGVVFSAMTSHSQRVQLEIIQQSVLRDKHFLKVDPFFYTFSISKGGAGSSEVLTYLHDFERLRANASLPAVYAIVVVPSSRAEDLRPPPAPDLLAYTPPQAMFRLRIHRASYHAAGTQPGLPVYERTGDLVSRDEETQLSVSAHSEAPFAQLRAGFVASYEGTGLNHRIALPHAYGRYEAFYAAGSSTQQCRFAHVRPQEPGSGLRLHLRARGSAARPQWLLLQFEVPCRAPLPLPPALIVTCEPSRNMPDPWQLRCPDADVVLLVLDTALTVATFYFLRDGALASEQQPAAQCIFVGAGAAWVNSVAFYSRPSHAELLRRLLRAAQLQQQLQQPLAASLSSTWRRERRVLTLNPVEHMRLELRFERDLRYEHTVSVGVDDVQLAPVLSSFPPQRARDVLCALVHLPSAEELAIIGLQTLIVDDNWRRLHVTISLETEAPCTYSAHLYPLNELNEQSATEQLPDAQVCPAAPARAIGLQRVGCELRTVSDNVRGAYAECQLEVPLGGDNSHDNSHNAATRDVGVAVRAEPGCHLSANDSLVAWLRPNTALYSCPNGQFRDASGACSNCHDSEAQLARCPLGQRLSACPALEPDASLCVNCSEGAEVVAQGSAHWVSSSTAICAWLCNHNFFRDGALEKCTLCSTPAEPSEPCPPGERWQPCQARQDARCVPCDALAQYAAAGYDSTSAEYVTGCQTRCRAGFYNDTDGRCKRCWDRAELVLHAALEHRFFAFLSCTASSNAKSVPCAQEEGARIVASDPGAGTAADPFTGRCVLECEPGWRRRAASEPGNATCVQCKHPRRVESGAVTQHDLEQRAFAWQRESCAFACLPPWQSTRARGSLEDTCVLCEQEDGGFLCANGEYPHGPLCACHTCDALA